MNENSGGGNRGLVIFRATIFILIMAIVGFAVGAWFSATFIVASNSGLEGGAEVALGGFVGAVSFIIGAVLLIRRLTSRTLSMLTVVILIVLALIFGFLFMRS